MIVHFVRSRKINFQIKNSEDVRSFLFDMAISLTGYVDPVSGMIVNLVKVDEWFDQFCHELKIHDWQNLLSFVNYLDQKVALMQLQEGVVVTKYQLDEFRHWGIESDFQKHRFWQSHKLQENSSVVELTEFYEGLPSEQELDLLIKQVKISRQSVQVRRFNPFNQQALIENY